LEASAVMNLEGSSTDDACHVISLTSETVGIIACGRSGGAVQDDAGGVE
jgi:hypothetical protein